MANQGGSSRMKSNSPALADVLVLGCGIRVRADMLKGRVLEESIIEESMKVEPGFLCVSIVVLVIMIRS